MDTIFWTLFLLLSHVVGSLPKTNKADSSNCSKKLGLENGQIPDRFITASSSYSNLYAPYNGRLHLQAGRHRAGAWAARHNDNRQWFQADFVHHVTVSGVATQGRDDANEWVTSYSVSVSRDGKEFRAYRGREKNVVFKGNTDRDTVVRHMLNPPVTFVRFIRIHPVTWHKKIALRAEFFGCQSDKASRPDASSKRKSNQYMSYLNVPRLHFVGLFQADTATANNKVKNYDISKFTRRSKLSTQEYRDGDGGWNPRGTNDWRLAECKVTSACYNDGKCENWHKPTIEEMMSEEEDESDPVLGAVVADDTAGTAAKVVDLDPQDMTVSTVYGWRIRIGDLFSADFRPAPLKGFWTKVANSTPGQGDSGSGAEYQSVLYNIKWISNARSSKLMRQIHAAMKSIGSNELSIHFNVDRFDMRQASSLFTWGRIAGSIGVQGPRSPPFHAHGRIMRPEHETMDTNTQFIIDEHLKRVFIDLGNTLPINKKGHYPSWLGTLAIGYVEDIETEELNCSTKIKWIGEVPYRQHQWYRNTTGLASLALRAEDIHKLTNRPLVMAQVAGNGSNCTCREIMLAEADNGLEVRPFDAWVFRKEAGEQVNLKGFVTRFGRLQPNVEIEVRPRSTELYDREPKINTPKLYLPKKPIKSDANGIVEIRIHTRDPGNPRKIIDGQVYYYIYGLSGEDFDGDADKTIRIHVYDNYTYTQPPNWIKHVYPIFKQYANLFPVMTEHFLDLGNYEEVVNSKRLIAMSMKLPESHPNYMPITRDLSQAKKNMILEWLGQEHPLKGREKDLYTLQRLRDHLQTALEIEHATIPPYLTALVSIKRGYNIEVQKIIKTIIRQEMLHMALVANILNAIGGRPKLYYRDFIPRFPSRLPGEVHPSLVVPLEKCSIGLIRNVFMKIEEPVFTQQVMTDRRRLLEIYQQQTNYVDNQGYAHVRELGKYNSVMMKRIKRKRDREVDEELSDYYDYEKHTKANHESERDMASVEENHVNMINDKISRSASAKKKKRLDKNEDGDLFFTRCIPREEEKEDENEQRDDSEPDMQDRLGDLWNEPLLRHHNTIGGLYNRILKGLGYLTNCGQNNSIFTGDHKRQITPNHWMSRIVSEKPNIFKVVDYRSAVAAVKEIVEQGEGSSPCNPLAVYANHTDELSHYFLFSSIVEGYNITVYPDGKHQGYGSREEHRKLKQCDETYNFDGHRIPFDPNGVWPIMTNPQMSKYLKTRIFVMAQTFNKVYTQLLKNLETVFNGHPDAIQDTMGLMYSVTLYAKRLVSTPLNPKGDPNIGPNAAPTYTFTSD